MNEDNVFDIQGDRPNDVPGCTLEHLSHLAAMFDTSDVDHKYYNIDDDIDATEEDKLEVEVLNLMVLHQKMMDNMVKMDSYFIPTVSVLKEHLNACSLSGEFIDWLVEHISYAQFDDHHLISIIKEGREKFDIGTEIVRPLLLALAKYHGNDKYIKDCSKPDTDCGNSN